MAPAPTVASASHARLGVRDSQRVFRVLLDALARPGLPAGLPPGVAPGVPRALVPVLALADVDVKVAVLAESREAAGAWHELVRTATGASAAPAERADMVAALRLPDPGEVAGLVRGSAAAPEDGARLTVACRALAAARGDGRATSPAAAPAVRIEVTGPGVPGRRRFVAIGLAPEIVAAIDEANRGYPAGVDTWLVDDAGVAIGLPRTARLGCEEVH